MSSSSQKCAVCNRSFGITLWKHTCDVCHRTVCDDCAPRNTESVDAKGKATELRVCKTCGVSGRRLGDVTPGQSSSAPAATGAAAPRADPNSETERARRVAAVEARNKSQQSRGRPQSGSAVCDSRGGARGGAASGTLRSSVLPFAAPLPAPKNNMSPTSVPPSVTSPAPAAEAPATAASATPPPPSAASGNASRPTNPTLEAALRRQQQQQAHNGATGAGAQAAANASPEKLQLLREIEALLAKHSEEPPFGLRASDETKLKGYLQYLKTKYHVAE